MNLIDLLRDTCLFSKCKEEDLVRIEDVAQNKEFSDGELLFSQGDEAKDLMVLASGKVQLELPVSILGQHKSIPFDTKGQGEVMGWSALVPPYQFTLSARSAGRTSVVVFPRAVLITILDSDPELGSRVMRNLASIIGQRLHHTQAMWVSEIQRSLDERYR